MRLLAIILLAGWALAGCGSTGGAGSDTHTATARAKAHTELAGAYYENGQYAIALEELNKALKFDSHYAPAYNVRGLVHMTLREDKEAESDFERSLDLDDANSDTHNNYGWFLCQRGRERDSIKQFLTAVKDPLYTTPEKAFLNAGICSKKAGQIKDAEAFLQRALILQPDMPEGLANMAEIYFINGDYAGAKSYLMRFERISGAALNAENLLLALRIEHKLGNRDAEAAYAARLRKNFPESRETQLIRQVR